MCRRAYARRRDRQELQATDASARRRVKGYFAGQSPLACGPAALCYVPFQEHVVIGVGVERRVEVNQINAGIRDVLAKNAQVVAKIELIFSIYLRGAYHNLRSRRIR
jgi:hypothetical protein